MRHLKTLIYFNLLGLIAFAVLTFTYDRYQRSQFAEFVAHSHHNNLMSHNYGQIADEIGPLRELFTKIEIDNGTRFVLYDDSRAQPNRWAHSIRKSAYSDPLKKVTLAVLVFEYDPIIPITNGLLAWFAISLFATPIFCLSLDATEKRRSINEKNLLDQKFAALAK